jgi:hypothetical protein
MKRQTSKHGITFWTGCEVRNGPNRSLAKALIRGHSLPVDLTAAFGLTMKTIFLEAKIIHRLKVYAPKKQ